MMVNLGLCQFALSSLVLAAAKPRISDKLPVSFDGNALIPDRSRTQPPAELHLDKLDVPSLLGIFDHLNFEEMINIASINDNFRQLIIDHYLLPHAHIGHKTIRIEASGTHAGSSDAMTMQFDKIETIRSYETALRLLRNFGHLIESIAFNPRNFTHEESAMIGDHIIAYCATNLREFELIEFIDSDVQKFVPALPNIRSLLFNQAPTMRHLQLASQHWPRLESLSLAHHWRRFGKGPVHFENVKHLRVINRQAGGISDRTPFPLTFGRLESVEIVVGQYLVDMLYAQLLAQNPGIKTLAYRRGLTRYDSMLNYLHLLPELKELTCRWWPDDQAFDRFPWTQLDRVTFIVQNQPIDEPWDEAELLRQVPSEWAMVDAWEENIVERYLRYTLYHVVLARID